MRIFIFSFFKFNSSLCQNIFHCNIPLTHGFTAIPNLLTCFKCSLRKTTGFKSLWVNCREINHVTSKWRIDFFQLKLTIFNFWNELTYCFLPNCRGTGEVRLQIKITIKKLKITIKFYIFELVEVLNFNFNKH